MAVALCGCTLRRDSVVLQGAWSRPAEIQGTAGRELCVDFLAKRVRRQLVLVLEAELLDSQGKPVPSRMPELAGESGGLRLRREVGLGPRQEESGSVCSFVPLQALPDPAAAYGFVVLLRDEGGQVLATLQGSLPP